MSSRHRWKGVQLTDADVAAGTRAVLDAAAARRALPVHLCNAYSLTLAERDADLREALGGAGALNLIDGVPVAWVLRLAGAGRVRTCRGPSLFARALAEGRDRGLRQVFLGGTPTTAATLASRLLREGVVEGPEQVISPPFEPFTPDAAERHAQLVREQAPDLVWVGLGTPKQDRSVQHLAHALSVPAVAVGAAFDFYAGTIEEAPPALRGTGLEWVHRLAADPHRLWRRYTSGNIRFALAAGSVVREARRARRPSREGPSGPSAPQD